MLHHPDRHLRLDGASNFRDLGGYAGRDGRTLRWRRLFRSDHLAGLSEADRRRLVQLGLARAFDFRGVTERESAAYDLPGLHQHPLSIEPEVMDWLQAAKASGRTITVPVVVGLMQDLYRSLVGAHAHRFAELFEQLLDADAPLVFHCTAGKDRTGVAAALILLALGVPRDVVMQDYLLTNALYRRPSTPPSQLSPEAVDALWRVQEDFLEAALQAIDGEAGGLEAYLQHRLRLSPAARRALETRYLEGG